MSEILSKKPATKPFWKTKTLDQLSPDEWELLCDGCGKCCLHKLEEKQTRRYYYTDISCQLLDSKTCQCTDYNKRRDTVPDCISLTPKLVRDLKWLPPSCSYRLVDEGKPLPAWHHLNSGSRETIILEGASCAGRVTNELDNDDPLEHHIIDMTEY